MGPTAAKRSSLFLFPGWEQSHGGSGLPRSFTWALWRHIHGGTRQGKNKLKKNIFTMSIIYYSKKVLIFLYTGLTIKFFLASLSALPSSRIREVLWSWLVFCHLSGAGVCSKSNPGSQKSSLLQTAVPRATIQVDLYRYQESSPLQTAVTRATIQVDL